MRDGKKKETKVLILVLMEYGLRELERGTVATDWTS